MPTPKQLGLGQCYILAACVQVVSHTRQMNIYWQKFIPFQ